MYDSMFDDFLKDLFRLNKDSFRFNSPISRVYETYPIDATTVLLTLNLLGISPEDIKVDVKNSTSGLQTLTVNATTENKVINKKYTYSNEFTIGSTRRELESYEWEAKDGILYIALKYKELAKVKEIKASNTKGLLESLSSKVKKEE